MRWGRYIIGTIIIGAAYGAAALAMGDRPAEWVGGPGNLVGITAALIGVNLAMLLLYGFLAAEKQQLPVLLSAVVHLVLFFLLHRQLFALAPDVHYDAAGTPALTDWLVFLGSRVIDGLDLPDLLAGFGLTDPSAIAARSVMAKAALCVMTALLGGLAVAGLLKWTAARLSGEDELPPALEWGVVGTLASSAVLMAVIAWLDNWPALPMVLWPLENLVAVVDFPDLLAIFGPGLDHPNPGTVLTVLAAVFRLAALGCLVVFGGRLYASLTGGGKPPIDDLAAVFLSAEHPLEERVGAIRTLSRYGAFAESAIPHLIKALADENPEVRGAAAETLGTIDPDWSQNDAVLDVLPSFIKSLKSRDKGTRIAAAEVIGAIGPPAESAVDRLAAGVDDPDSEVRVAMIQTLKKMGPAAEKAVDPLIGHLTDADDETREAAAHTIMAIGDPAIPALVKTLTSEDDALRGKAAATLDAIDPEWPRGGIAKAAVGHFTDTIRTGFGGVRIAAIEALAGLGASAREALPDLVAVLIDGDKDVRNAGVKALKKIDPKWFGRQEAKKAAPDLLKALVDSDKSVQATAAKVLEKVQPDWPVQDHARDAIPHFAAALDHGLETVRIAGAETLGRIGPAAKEATPNLIVKLSDNDPKVRAAAGAALTQVNPKWREDPSVANAIPALVENLAADDWRKRAAAAGALGEIGPETAEEALPPLVERLADGDKNARLAVRAALKKIDPQWPRTKAARSRIPDLMKSLGESQWSARAAAVEALGIFGPSAAKLTAPRLAKVMNTDSIPDVRAIAKKTLAKVDPEGKFH